MLLFNARKANICEMWEYFNTSNVTIQRSVERRRRLKTIISIHLMLLFNPPAKASTNKLYTISIHLMLLFNHVKYLVLLSLGHFNTSNVTIQLTGVLLNVHYSLDFNTSNVTIQPHQNCNKNNNIRFQYI